MKITFLTPRLKISGGVRIICEYACRLAQRGHQVTLLAKERKYPLFRGVIHTLINTVKWIDLKGIKIKFVPTFVEKNFPDSNAIFATSWQTVYSVSAARASKGKKFYLVQHIESLISREKEKVNTTYSFPLNRIAVSRWLQKMLLEEFGQPSEYIPNAIDHDQFFPEDKTYGTRRVGMLHHTADWKGISDGLSAMKMVRERLKNIHLILFGVRRKYLKNIDAEYYYDPSSTELRRLYSSCDVFLCPSWYEGFGLPGLEAMACKSALVTTDNGGCRDYAIHNETALISPAKDPQALAENTIKLLTDSTLLRRLSESGYNMAQKFNWESSVQKMENIIQNKL